MSSPRDTSGTGAPTPEWTYDPHLRQVVNAERACVALLMNPKAFPGSPDPDVVGPLLAIAPQLVQALRDVGTELQRKRGLCWCQFIPPENEPHEDTCEKIRALLSKVPALPGEER